MQTPALYGIKHSNRNFEDSFYWGKNQFNSSFPIALACYMRDNQLGSPYVQHIEKKKTAISVLGFDEVFGTTLPNEQIKFNFETTYKPFEQYVEDKMEHIDVVLCEAKRNSPIRPLEVKLTTLPDDATSTYPENEYGAELVIRSPTMRYMALSMSDICNSHKSDVRQIFDDSCKSIRDWSNAHEMLAHKSKIFTALENFLDTFHSKQRPLLIQPIWKTIGKSAQLSENCLDIFTWSDFALARLFMDAIGEETTPVKKITRQQRAALRLSRFLYEWSKSNKVFQKPIYDGMTFDTLNDKEFAVSGRQTNRYMACDRLSKPIVTKSEIKKIILGGGQKYLSPERRFDAIIYFSKDLFNE